MKNNSKVNFVKTTVIGGVVFLVPLVCLIFIINQAMEFMMLIAEPLADWIPIESIGDVALANLLAIVALIIVSFIAGLVARTTIAGGFIKTLESKVLAKIPGYTMIKGIKSGFDTTESKGMKPIAVKFDTAERIALEIEKLPDGRSMVYIPSAPSPWSGITLILPADQITYLDVPVTRVMELTEQYGQGVDSVLQSKQNADVQDLD